MIEAIAKLARSDIYYSICGEGPNRKNLETEIKKYGLSDRVFLQGYRNDMPKYGEPRIFLYFRLCVKVWEWQD